jgi:hypothetical protein
VSNRRRLLLSPLWLLIALTAVLGLNATSAAAGSAAETRVRAFEHVTVDAVGQQSSERPASVGCVRPETADLASGSCVAADDVPLHSSNFVVHPNGEIVPVPTGAIGPTPARTGSGFQFRGGSGGHGLDPRVTDVRIMDPVVGGKHPLPNGYVSYGNASGQTVKPWTGRTIDPGNPWWHWQWSP